MIEIVDRSALLDELLAASASQLGPDLPGYRNHCYRVLNFALALAPALDGVREKVEIATFFHDVGIWTDGTFDYLEPSAARARRYLEERQRSEWSRDVLAMITRHHQITSAKAQGALVNAFRRADWADVSLGVLRAGLPARFVRDVRQIFPDEGFHVRLVELTLERLRHHPFSPLPMLRWS
jgi:predicted metal-dependent HD superfamily phosphohydrolase